MNYQSLLDNIINEIPDGYHPRLLLHSCCGPCSSYVLEYLTKYFEITVFYCNPCIAPSAEYEHRKEVQKSLIAKMNSEGRNISFIEDEYDHQKFLDYVNGHENDAEGGERCHLCYEQRLALAAQVAKDDKFDYFTTTLTVSPYKNCEVLNNIGKALSDKYEVKYLPSDFKKREGYKRSIELSKVYGLYRQDYCGCEFSFRNVD